MGIVTSFPPDAVGAPRWSRRNDGWTGGTRDIAEETAIALTYNGATYAVMMATPADVADFAIGFSLTEGIIQHTDDIEEFEVLSFEAGIDVRLWLRSPTVLALETRRRHMAGPVGCGMCGLASLEQASRVLPVVPEGLTISADLILAAMASLRPAQALNQRTHAVHAAAFWQPDRGLVAIREDVGRHNAFDKLAGTLSREETDLSKGIVLLSSRLSVEMVQKAAMIGASLVVAVSAPTALALRTAEDAGITLVGIAREDGYEVFTRPDRIADCPRL